MRRAISRQSTTTKAPCNNGKELGMALTPRRWHQSGRLSLKIFNGKEVDSVGLGVGDLRNCSQHLRSSEQDAHEKGHIGPRHAILRGAPLNDTPHGQVLRCGPRASRIRTQIENLINYSRASLTVKRQKLFQIEATAVAPPGFTEVGPAQGGASP